MLRESNYTDHARDKENLLTRQGSNPKHFSMTTSNYY